ncbi:MULTISPECIES: TraB/GumN family protein [unclassified Thiocapsa]|uniref:TraB/GumN family protein n=1 Tax=unclassified Thiocapsa TaxID=2641286 RepID=UPI0035B1FD85
MIGRLLLAAWLVTCACARAEPSTTLDAPAGSSATRGILYEIRPPTGTPRSFLFGTIHSDDARVAEMPIPVRDAFIASPGVALEVVPDASAIIRAMVTMAYTDGRLLRDVLPADLYLETSRALTETGMPEEAFKDLKPWSVVTLLSSPPSETGEFLDMLLFDRAVADGKQVEGLETMTEQLAVFDDLSEDDQITLLRETLATREQLPLVFEALIAAYIERDVDKLQHLSEQHLAESDPRLAAHFQEVVIDSRNRRMVERMVPLLAEGGWFIAIGALHLPGDQGILSLLRKRDYIVTAIF